jgi:hypothetical protein
LGKQSSKRKKGIGGGRAFKKNFKFFFFEKSAFLDFANQENWSVQGVSPL